MEALNEQLVQTNDNHGKFVFAGQELRALIFDVINGTICLLPKLEILTQ